MTLLLVLMTLLLVLMTLLFSSCNLEKRVVITTRGYEQYRQVGMADIQIKGLQRSDATQTDVTKSTFMRHIYTPAYQT